MTLATHIDMKTFQKIMIAAIAVAFVSAELSAKSGIEVGYLNTMYNLKAAGDTESADPLNGFYAGFTNDIKLIAGLSIQPGLYYSYGEHKDLDEEVGGISFTGTQSEHNLNIPINVKYSFGILPILKIHVFVGPTLSVGLASSYNMRLNGDFMGQTLDGNVRYSNYTGKFKSNNLSEEVETAINSAMPASSMSRFDVMIGGGIGIDLFKFLTVKGGYDYGLVNRYKGDVAGAALHRSQFYVALGIHF